MHYVAAHYNFFFSLVVKANVAAVACDVNLACVTNPSPQCRAAPPSPKKYENAFRPGGMAKEKREHEVPLWIWITECGLS